MAAELNEAIDNIAERATTLGGTAMGTVRMAANNSSLSEYPEGTNQCEQVVKVLADQYAAVAEQLRSSIEVASKHNDADTEDLFTEVSRQVDLRLWFLEAHLQ
jgi:starvation-inducible DNA-binding protein